MLLSAHSFCYQLSNCCTHDTLLLHGCADDPVVSQLYGLGAALPVPCMMSYVYAEETP